MDDRTPILIGAGQITQRDVAPEAVLEPVALMRDAARAAADDARLTADALARVDTVAVVNLLSWTYANAPRLLSEMLGAAPRDEIYTTIGGNSPQSLVDDTARRIASGEVGLALLAGAEVMNGVKRARRAGVRLAWGNTGDVPEPRSFGDGRQGTNDIEVRHGLFLPVQVYPLFENAIRARAGRTPGEHLRFLGELSARFSSVAAVNPYAWFRTPRTAEQIATVARLNGMRRLLVLDSNSALSASLALGDLKTRGVQWVSEDRLLLVDTASSNGTFEKGQQVRVVVLEADTELRLGKKTFARWRPVTK